MSVYDDITLIRAQIRNILGRLERVAPGGGGTVAPAALSGVVRTTDTDYEDLTDGGTTALHSHVGGGVSTIVRKTANETVNNSAVLQDDDHLFYALAANEEVFFKAVIKYTSNVTPDLKMAFTVPAGATVNWWHVSRTVALATTMDFKTGSGTTDSFGGADATVLGIIIEGICNNGATAGNLQLQWAQNTQNASDTILYENSCLLVWVLAT